MFMARNKYPTTEAGCALQDDEAQWRVPFEDSDAVPGYEVRLSESKDVSCLHMDHVNNILWTGAYAHVPLQILVPCKEAKLRMLRF